MVGAAFSANKGAASMAQALVDRLPEVIGVCRIEILTTYPREDLHEVPQAVQIVSLRPRELVFPVLPIALLVALARGVGASGRWFAGLHPATRSLFRADVVLDVAGISFADGRSFPILVYNVLMTGVPLLLGAPVIKCSQAVGPFRSRFNRIAARMLLPRLRAVLTRGERTHQHAVELGLVNAQRADDLAFLMEVTVAASDSVRALLSERGVDAPFVLIAPSSVVRSYAADRGLDYANIIVELIRSIREEQDLDVVIVAHSARPGRPESRMNDLPLCAEIHAALDDAGTHLIDANLRPAELRALIGASDTLITSRFHAMISALATETPVLVVGWSHKYEEVLSEFDLTELTVPYDRLDAATLIRRFDDVWSQRSIITERITDGLPRVRTSAEVNLDAIRRELDVRSRR